jgi:DNA helicase-2/ATP-dependent DNA helicase PcrA
VRNIREVPEIFPGTDIIKLERNYRSYQSILDVAGDVVSHNAGRLGKKLVAERLGGQKPVLALLDDQDAEVAYCVKACKERVKAGGRWSDIAILYRTNAQSLSFEKEFPRLGIPYRIVGSSRFYDREEVKDALAYMALLCNPRDEVAFKRVVNKPSRGVGETSVDLILGAAEASLSDLLEQAAKTADSLKGKARGGTKEFLSIVGGLKEALSAPNPDGESLGGLIERLVRSSGLVEYHRAQDEVAGTQKVSNLEELDNAASLYPRGPEGLADFLETIELDRSLSSEEVAADAVTLITMHNTKGLEFPVVIATGLEQGLFPREEEEGEELEEQRRLFYVAITRAKDELHLTSCRWRRLHGRLYETGPSRFLSEIDGSLIKTMAAKKTQAAPSGAAYGSGRGYGAARGYADPASAGNLGRPTPGRSAPDKEANPWRAGTAVYHDDYGSGVVLKVSATPSSGPLVVVRFESGRQAQFFPKFTKKLEIQRG